jgi:small neutral amino acid transporter SnatA (MarC family)
MAGLWRMIATLGTCGLAYGVFVSATPVAERLGIGELQLLTRLGLTFAALGLADMAITKFSTHPPHNP